MAHGFGAERSFGLPAFAQRFARAGLAVLLFDYRCFGDSDGEPRNWVSAVRHCQDWRAAVRHVRTLASVDGGRVGLWGSSFSGGHVIATAAKDGEIAAISAQVPFVDPFSSIRLLGPVFLLRALPTGCGDMIRMLFGRSPHHVPLVGRPETFAVMNTPESWDGYMAIVPGNTAWRNRCPARILLTFSLYRPMSFAAGVRCPALVMLAENDSSSMRRRWPLLPPGCPAVSWCVFPSAISNCTAERTSNVRYESRPPFF
jgi:pimeloyl-ACP methyl ester carboxylesterase